MADGYWYHGNGKIGGEFHPTKPNGDLQCKNCDFWGQETAHWVQEGYKICSRLSVKYGKPVATLPDFYCGAKMDGEKEDESTS